MGAVNKVILIGNLGKDPQVKYFDNGKAVATFTLATTETYKDKNGQRVDNTQWHNISLWSPLAEIAEKYLKKGNQVYIEGRLTTRDYEDKEGIKRYITEVVGRDMTLLGGPNQNNSEGGAKQEYAKTEPAGKVDSEFVAPNGSDDLPF